MQFERISLAFENVWVFHLDWGKVVDDASCAADARPSWEVMALQDLQYLARVACFPEVTI